MALFGTQLVFTMIMATFLHKITPHFSFARWLLCRGKLVRYLHPTSDELKKLAGIAENKNKAKRERNNSSKSYEIVFKTFMVPRNLNFQLTPTVIESEDVGLIKFYPDYQWLVDFSFSSVIVYVVTEVYYHIMQPQSELNLSLVWVILVIYFNLRILWSLMTVYLQGEDWGEVTICLLFTFFYFVFSLGILLVDEDILEFQLENAYDSFTGNATILLKKQGLREREIFSIGAFKMVLAILGAILGGFLTFPGFRLARMHYDLLKETKSRPLLQSLFHVNFLFPLLIVLMWVKPLARDYLKSPLLAKKLTGLPEPLVSDEGFEAARVGLVVLGCLLRLLLMGYYLQAYLNMAKRKLERIKKEAGKINSLFLQKTVANVYFYFCVAILQYLVPLILLLFTVFLLITLGINGGAFAPPKTADGLTGGAPGSVSDLGQQFSTSLASLATMFNSQFYTGVLSYLCWWIATSWLTSSVIGYAYFSQFNQD